MNDISKHPLSKVPEVTLVFWIIKIAATTLGETGGRHRDDDAQLGISRGDAAISRGARHFGSRANPGEKVPSVSLLGDDRRVHHVWNDDGRFCRPLAGHRLYGRVTRSCCVCLMACLESGIGRRARSRWIRSTRLRWKPSTGSRSRFRRRSAPRLATGWRIRRARIRKQRAGFCAGPRGDSGAYYLDKIRECFCSGRRSF